jgi:hypothetical protein
MTTFTVAKYEVFELAGAGQPVRLYMHDDVNSYRGYIDFIAGYAGAQKFVVHSNGIINAFMPLDRLHLTLDLLRNEKPVYFSVNEPYNWAALKTGQEPTGEEEAAVRV